MTKSAARVIAAALCLLSGSGAALTAPDPIELSRSPAWHKLLQYESQSDGTFESRVIEPGFFVSKSGMTDPAAELTAFVAALRDPAQLVGVLKQPAACVFPARTRLVRATLGIVPAPAACSDFLEWRDRLAARSVTLVFASAYVNNPASLFGHTLLRINTHPASDLAALEARALLNYTVSFLAQTDPNDSMASYTLKGLTGGYWGAFNVDPYYMSVAVYNNGEDRDLWEYDLELPPETMAMLVEHLWELSNNARIPYFFATENCSFQIMAMLEAVMPERGLVDAIPRFVLPLDTVRVALDQRLTLKRVRRRVALGTVMQAAVASLSADDRAAFEQLAAKNADALAATTSVPAFDAAVAYWNYRKFAAEGKLEVEDTRWLHDLLVRRAALGAAERALELSPATETVVRPDQGHATSAVGLFGGREGDTSFGTAMVRAGLHDLLGDPRGYDGAAAITYAELAARVAKRADAKAVATLERAVIADVTSLSPYTSLVPRWSWRLAAGGRRVGVSGDRPFAVYGEAAAGMTVAPMGGWLIFAMPTYSHDAAPRLPQGFRAAPGFTTGVIARASIYRTLLAWEWERQPTWFGQAALDTDELTSQHALSLGRNDELRAAWRGMRAQGERLSAWELGWLRYF